MEPVETKQITVTIAGRAYPLKISTRDEATIRKIVKEINEKINRFQLNYPKKDKQDCLAMAALTYAVDLQVARQKPTTPDEELSRKLSQLDKLLDSLLS